ncbi:MAG: hypothetical protein ACM3US_08105 [Sphingomonadaceae bacterium]
MRFAPAPLALLLSAALPFVSQLLFGAGLLDEDVFLQSLPAWSWLSHALRSGEGSAVRLLPTWEVMQLSTLSAGLPQEVGASGSQSIRCLLVGYLLPLSRMELLPWGSLGHAGPAVVVLVLLGMRDLVTRNLNSFLLWPAILGQLLSLGDATSLGILLQLPPFSWEPSRLTLVSIFSLSILAGMVLALLAIPTVLLILNLATCSRVARSSRPCFSQRMRYSCPRLRC